MVAAEPLVPKPLENQRPRSSSRASRLPPRGLRRVRAGRAAAAVAWAASAVACAPSYRAVYPDSLCRVLQQETPPALAAHASLLEQVIDSFEGAPPAGLELELAYYAARLGDHERARAALERERARYPELAALLEAAAGHLRALPAVVAPPRE
jgi:hypothetical protein